MSDTQTDELQQHARAAGKAGPGPDFDAEHDSARASRSSRADLKRVASAEGAPMTEAAQRDKANTASANGLAEAATFAAKQLILLAHEIDAAFAAPPSDAGWEPRMQLVQSHVKTASDGVARLALELGVAKSANEPMEQLSQRMAGFHHAYAAFCGAVTNANNDAARGHQPLTADTKGLENQVNELYAKHGWTPIGFIQGSHPGQDYKTLDAGNHDQMFVTALQTNLTALTESARLARMSLKGGSSSDHERDVLQVAAHVMVVHDLVQSGDPKKMAACGKQALIAKGESQQLYSEARAINPDISSGDLKVLNNANIFDAWSLLQHKVIHK